MIGLDLAVEHAQRIRLRAALAIAAHLRSDRLQLLAQPGHVLRPAIGVAHGVDQQLESGQPDGLQDLDHHLDHFRVDHRRLRPDRLRPDLVELPIPPLLRPFAPEHRADIVQLLHARTLVEAVLDVGADHRRRVLRTQRQRSVIAVLERVHFLGDDVGFLADATREQLRFFQNRCADFVVIIGAEDIAGD